MGTHKHCLKQFTALKAVSIRTVQSWNVELFSRCQNSWQFCCTTQNSGTVSLSFLTTILSPQCVKYLPCSFAWMYRLNAFLIFWKRGPGQYQQEALDVVVVDECKRVLFSNKYHIDVIFLIPAILFLKQGTQYYWYVLTVLKFIPKQSSSVMMQALLSLWKGHAAISLVNQSPIYHQRQTITEKI